MLKRRSWIIAGFPRAPDFAVVLENNQATHFAKRVFVEESDFVASSLTVGVVPTHPIFHSLAHVTVKAFAWAVFIDSDLTIGLEHRHPPVHTESLGHWATQSLGKKMKNLF